MENQILLKNMLRKYRAKESLEIQLKKIDEEIEKDVKELDYRIKHNTIK